MNKNYSEYYKMIGLNIAYFRKLKGYTQEELSEIIEIDQTHLSKIERATVGVSIDLLIKIAEALEIDVYKFFVFNK